MNRLEQVGVVALLRATVPHLKQLGYGDVGRSRTCAECGSPCDAKHDATCMGVKLLRDVESAVREFG